jgi:Rrf2 family iron-sulfur cluster assembly transcriptional regulator
VDRFLCPKLQKDKVFHRKRGLVDATRGPGGGYRLLKSSDDISVADVIDAVDETVDATRCGGQQNCQGEKRCLTHDLWADLSTQIRDFLGNISLNELVGQRGVQIIRQWQDERADDEHRTSRV